MTAGIIKRDKAVLPYHSQKGRAYYSIFGKLSIERAYFDQKGHFPSAEEGSILVAQADGKGVPMVRGETDLPAPVPPSLISALPRKCSTRSSRRVSLLRNVPFPNTSKSSPV